jgi:sugar phosphate isomerase/epimerase
MDHSMNRRHFLQTAAAAGAGLGLTGFAGSRMLAAELAKGAPNAEKLGWRLGMQAWTMRLTSLFDAIDTTAALGLHYIEAFPGQKIGGGCAERILGDTTSADDRNAIKKKLSDAGVKLVNLGVCELPNNLDQSRRMFEFAKDMGLETLVSEPTPETFDLLDKLTEEYGINVALHNHPKPSIYWNPDTELKAFQGHSKRIGACADAGHWPRSGLNSLECLKKLDGHIISLHFKDLNEVSPEAHDVPWGTGVCDVKGMLAEIHRQKIKPFFGIEYEYHWGNAIPEIAQSIAYFDKCAAELTASS